MRSRSWDDAEDLARGLEGQLGESAAIVLIGSVARECEIARSDVDLVIVSESRPHFKLRSPRFEFHQFDKSRFLGLLASGDDFPNWCFRFGVPLIGAKYWEQMLQSVTTEGTRWPDWRRKIEISCKRLLAANLFLQTDDCDAASESALLAYDHFVRGLLLRDSEFPLSRPELCSQVTAIAPRLARNFRELMFEQPNNIHFSIVLDALSESIRSLTPDLYEKFRDRLERFSTRRVARLSERSMAPVQHP